MEEVTRQRVTVFEIFTPVLESISLKGLRRMQLGLQALSQQVPSFFTPIG